MGLWYCLTGAPSAGQRMQSGFHGKKQSRNIRIETSVLLSYLLNNNNNNNNGSNLVQGGLYHFLISKLVSYFTEQNGQKAVLCV